MSNKKLLKKTLQQAMLVTPAKIKNLVNDLQKDGSAKALELANALKTLPPKMFTQKPGEQKMSEIIATLQKRNVNQKKIKEIVMGIAQSTSEVTLDRLTKLMSPKIKQKWDNVLDKGPNVYQQFILLDYFCKASRTKPLEEYFDEILIETITKFTHALKNQEKLNKQYNSLNKETSKEVEVLIKTGQFEEALILMNKG